MVAIDILKIDKSFVEGIALGPEQSAVARAVVKLARTFSLQTVAEGARTIRWRPSPSGARATTRCGIPISSVR